MIGTLAVKGLIFHLPFYHNQFRIIKILKQTVNPFTLKNLQNKISFSYMIFLTVKMSLKRCMKRRLVTILTLNLHFKWRQIVNSIPKTWKKVLEESQSDSSNLVLLDHKLLKNNRILGIEKINSKEIYSIIILSKVNLPKSRIYFDEKFALYNFQ